MHTINKVIRARKLLAISTVFMVLLAACHKDSGVSASTVSQPAAPSHAAYHGYLLGLTAELDSGAPELSASVEIFLNKPDKANLDQARDSWLKLHSAMVKLEAYCNLPSQGEIFRQLWFDLEAWPLEPGYIDALPEYPDSGIINDLAMPLTEAALRSQHGATALTEISTGMHALEYLLWQRPLEDYEPRDQLSKTQLESGLSVEQLSNNRRREMLRLVVRLAMQDLTVLQQLLTGSLKEGAESKLLEPRNMIELDLKAIHRTLTEVQQNSTDFHSLYSQSWPADILTLIHQVQFLADQQLGQASPQKQDRIRQSIAKIERHLTELDASDSKQLSIILDLSKGLDSELSTLFSTTPD